MPTSELGFLPTGLSVPGSGSHSVYRLAASRSGYASAPKDLVPDDLEVQIPATAFLVSRGNSGLGKANCFDMAKRGEQPAVCPLGFKASLRPLHTGKSAQCHRPVREGLASMAMS